MLGFRAMLFTSLMFNGVLNLVRDWRLRNFIPRRNFGNNIGIGAVY